MEYLKYKLQNPVVRWVCLALALVAVMALIASAAGAFKQPLDEDEEDEKDTVVRDPNVLLVADCESVDGFKNLKFGGNFATEVNTQYKTQGYASVGGFCNDVTFSYAETVFTGWYQLDEPMDITGMTHYVFDIYVDNPNAFNGAFYTVELNSDEDPDTHEIQTQYLSFSGLVEGWNTVKIPLTNFTGKIGSFDPTNFTMVRFYNGSTSGGGSYNGGVYFDNIRFVKEG